MRLVSVSTIWNEAPHNAFTDLLRWQGQWYCVFREGQAHVSPDGALRIIASSDGKEWASVAHDLANGRSARCQDHDHSR